MRGQLDIVVVIRRLFIARWCHLVLTVIAAEWVKGVFVPAGKEL